MRRSAMHKGIALLNLVSTTASCELLYSKYFKLITFMLEYQNTQRYFAQIASGMEELGVAELSELNARNIEPAFRGIYFDADKAALYRINYQARLLTRVLAPLEKFHCYSTQYLYKKARSIDWTDLFTVNHTFSIFSSVSHSKITHSQYAALCLKDAIVDYFRDNFGNRPSVERIAPDVWINLHIENNRAVISLDTSGGSLHRRGYRKESVDAPMQETLAAAIIRLTGWDGSGPFYDLMCGSGTLLCEALMAHCRIPAGYLRKKFGFEFLPDFEPTLWKSIKTQSNQQIRKLSPGMLSGSDLARNAVSIARLNINTLPSGERISLKVTDFRNIRALENAIIICNPPYGIRLGQKNEVARLYKSLGDFLKQRCQGSAAYIYFGDRKLIPQIGLRTSWKKPLKNGALDGRLVKFELY